MNKQRIISLIAILLLVMNVILLVYIQMRKGPEHNGPRDIIIERLQLDKEQIIKYDTLIAHHRLAIRGAENEIRALKNQLYSQLISVDKVSPQQDSLIAKINVIQARIEYIHFAHFLEIKQCCKPDQLPYYNELTKEIAQLFAHNPRPRK
ncbi:MAG TPA: hypothetical protein PLU10_07195 [Chitinophagaceae bacterium]|nr:hypothetical protein [Chitinophagaceae bacterium]